MSISFIGVLGLLILAFVTESYETLDTTIYSLYVIFGIIGGTGLAVFSIGITNVSFWSPQRRQGRMSGIYGGLTNIAPGIDFFRSLYYI